jgi:hypothetical protein
MDNSHYDSPELLIIFIFFTTLFVFNLALSPFCGTARSAFCDVATLVFILYTIVYFHSFSAFGEIATLRNPTYAKVYLPKLVF